jgi:hypothetical protein
MEPSVLSSILLDGGAGYNVYTTKINYPYDSFKVLSSSARALIRLGMADVDISGDISPSDFVPDEWDGGHRRLFFDMSAKDQLDVCAFLTSIVHELFHHCDLLRTPFGASLHEKLCREFLSFERWMPTLLNAPIGFFDQPLADWALSAPVGPTEARRLQAGSKLDQALVELRGPISFDEVRRGTMPRHVKEGWAGNTKPITLTGGLKYEKVTVNELWATLRLNDGTYYLGPSEIIEGRTLALCLIYLFHLLGEESAGIDVVQRYVKHFYSGHPAYLTLLEIHSGLEVAKLLSEDANTIKRRLWETAVNGWYSLNCQLVVAEDDLLQSMTARCFQAARVMRDTNLFSFSNLWSFLSAIENFFSTLGGRPIRDSLKICTERLNGTITMCDDCKDSQMRNWYREILQMIRNDLLERIPNGYALNTGLPPDGNPIRWADEGAIRCVGLRAAPRRVAEWYDLRQLLVGKRGRAEEKMQRLRDFFSDSQ